MPFTLSITATTLNPTGKRKKTVTQQINVSLPEGTDLTLSAMRPLFEAEHAIAALTQGLFILKFEVR